MAFRFNNRFGNAMLIRYRFHPAINLGKLPQHL